MEGWGRQGYNANQEGGRTRQPNYKKPPLPLGGWQQTVPSWEKKFCFSVGSVPWRKILETKKCMHLYSNVVNWNDSAGEEAFQNAKRRFYANFHGIPCDIPLPDPNIYIDEIDWDFEIHPDVIVDLESGYVSPDAENQNVIIFGSALIAGQGYSSAGWGDIEDEVKKATNPPTSDWDSNNEGYRWVDNKNTWSQNEGKVDSNGWNNWNQHGNSSYVVNNNNNNNNNNVNGGGGGGWGEVNNGRRRREGSSGRYMSRYRSSSRFHGHDNYRNNSCWRNVNVNMNTTGQVGHEWS